MQKFLEPKRSHTRLQTLSHTTDHSDAVVRSYCCSIMRNFSYYDSSVTIRQSSGTKGASSSLTLFTRSRALITSRIRCSSRQLGTDGLLQPTTSTSVSVGVYTTATHLTARLL